ncbi:MAG: Smr/MutS family protein [Cyclobacteriaceae bacterium]|nr:Smr/MutS family protein [Cyclobacteriaceae bacterium]
MLYPSDIEQKLGFDKIREWLGDLCSGAYGRRNVDNIRFLTNSDIIIKLSRQTEELMAMITAGESLPTLGYPDIDEILQKLAVEGMFLEMEEMADVLISLKIQHAWQVFLRVKKDEYPEITALMSWLQTDPTLIKKIEACVDEHGNIRDNASPELRKIRIEIQRNEQLARKTLDRVIREISKSDMSPEDSSLTIRNGRLVIPVKSEYKRSVKGFIHDASASGNIIFIEPAEVLEINNDLKELSYSEKREIIRILSSLTNSLRLQREQIASGTKFLGIIDAIRAKAKLSLQFDALVPELNKDGKVSWIGARNPVLQKVLEIHGKKIIPLQFHLDRHKHMLIISGPNAGGKSVCLKTVGLLQYMFQCGMPVPALEGSVTTIFKDIFIGIGDEQSIEDDLSTYSSHLKSMNFLMKNASRNMFYLIDELGSGTDPQFGGAIAEAMLEHLVASGAMGVITTHYNNLKKMAETHKGIINGRMRFDVQKLEPLYMLEIGKPGSSFALEIAGKIGISKDILQKAREKAGSDAVSMEKLLSELEEEKRYFESETKALRDNNTLLEKSRTEFQMLKSEIDEKKRDIINEARLEAKTLLQETNQRIEKLIREIKENKASKEPTRQLREELRQFQEKIIIEKPRRKKETVTILDGPICQGDSVRIKGQTAIGEVLLITKNDVEIMLGGLLSKTKLNRLEKVTRSEAKKAEKENYVAVKGIDMVERRANFALDLDVRGKRAEEALQELERFLDNALLFGTHEVRIIHGKGDGILRTVMREVLRTRKEIKHFHDDHADRGGAGITVVELK